MSVCLCMCKIATKSHRNMKAKSYLNGGSDSVYCSLLAAVMEIYLFLLLCWVCCCCCLDLVFFVVLGFFTDLFLALASWTN